MGILLHIVADGLFITTFGIRNMKLTFCWRYNRIDIDPGGEWVISDKYKD